MAVQSRSRRCPGAMADERPGPAPMLVRVQHAPKAGDGEIAVLHNQPFLRRIVCETRKSETVDQRTHELRSRNGTASAADSRPYRANTTIA